MPAARCPTCPEVAATEDGRCGVCGAPFSIVTPGERFQSRFTILEKIASDEQSIIWAVELDEARTRACLREIIPRRSLDQTILPRIERVAENLEHQRPAGLQSLLEWFVA